MQRWAAGGGQRYDFDSGQRGNNETCDVCLRVVVGPNAVLDKTENPEGDEIGMDTEITQWNQCMLCTESAANFHVDPEKMKE